MDTNFYNNPDYSNVLIEYTGNIQNDIDKIPVASVYIVDDNYAILSVKTSEYENVVKSLNNIVYVEIDGLYTLSQTTPIESSQAPILKSNPYLNLNGTGVLIGIIDTGIDYLNTEFIREDDTTRIIRIWDHTILDSSTTNKLVTGKEYTEAEINKAIQASKKGEDPYAIVPSKDEIGHGTKMASIIGARGKNPDLQGVAPNCNFAVVKLQPTTSLYSEAYFFPYGDSPRYRGTDILISIKYLYDLARNIDVPLIIYLPLGGNVGAHDGSNVMERYIDEISQRRGIIVVTSTGNQGNSDTHASGTLNDIGTTSTLEVFAPPEQTGLFLIIYVSKPDKAILSIVSPSGEVIDKINPKALTDPRLDRPILVKFIYEGTTMSILYVSIDSTTGDQKIIIRASNLKTGIWQFKLTGSYVVSKIFNAWLLQKELLAPGTKFLNSSSNVTLTIPGTSKYAITTAYYNQTNNSIVSESGRGFTRYDEIKPLLASGGINAPTIGPNNTITTISGGSVAAAVLSGCCALLLQWGIVQNNNPTMYATTIQTHLIRGAAKRPGDTYPNPEWGYGRLDLIGVFNSLRDDSRSSNSNRTEFVVNGIFVRLPS